MALRAAGTRPTARAQDRGDGIAKPYFYDAGRILGRISMLYGYSLLISGISSCFLTGFSSLPLTRWDDEGGIPQPDVGVVSVLLMLWFTAGVSAESGAK